VRDIPSGGFLLAQTPADPLNARAVARDNAILLPAVDCNYDGMFVSLLFLSTSQDARSAARAHARIRINWRKENNHRKELSRFSLNTRARNECASVRGRSRHTMSPRGKCRFNAGELTNFSVDVRRARESELPVRDVNCNLHHNGASCAARGRFRPPRRFAVINSDVSDHHHEPSIPPVLPKLAVMAFRPPTGLIDAKIVLNIIGDRDASMSR